MMNRIEKKQKKTTSDIDKGRRITDAYKKVNENLRVTNDAYRAMIDYLPTTNADPQVVGRFRQSLLTNFDEIDEIFRECRIED